MGIYKLIDTPTGLKTLLFINSRKIRLHSAFNPLKESERAAYSFQPGRSNLIIVAGLGLGYHIKFLKKRYPDYLIITIERDSEVKDIVEKNYPDNIKDVYLINSVKDLPAIFEEIDISIIKGASTFIHRPSYMLYKDFYDSILKDIKEYISSKFSDLLTRFEFEENWIHHILRNVPYIYSSTPVSTLFGKFKNIPGIIVSAGPSLKKNVKLLNNLKDKALIVCVDTALMVLQKNNIIPHLVMTLDSQKYSLKHFYGLKNNKPILIADIVSHPRVIESYNGQKIISTTSKYYTDEKGNFKRETTPIWDWVEQFTGPIGDIQSGGSVATSIFDLFLNLGCKPIILLGQDLAYTGREIHCTGTYHNDEWLPITSRFINLDTINQNIIRKRKIKYVQAYNGKGNVISDFVFDIYKYWFKDSAGKIDIPVINATGGGARIENTEEKSIDQILSNIGNLKTSLDEILKSLIQDSNNNPKTNETLITGIIKAIKELEDLETRSKNLLNTQLSEKEILEIIDKSSISKLIMPFLRRTFVYIARHPNLAQEKASELLVRDIHTSSKKIIQMLEECKQNLGKIR